MAEPTPAAFRRDRSTWLLYTVLGVFGYFIYAFSASTPLLRDDHGTSALIAGMHVVAYAASTIGVGASGDRVVALLGRPRTLWTSLVGLCAAVVMFCFAPGPWLSLPAALIAGMTTSFLINAVTAALADGHGRFKVRAITEANALAGAMGIISPLILSGVLAAGWNWRAAMLLIVALVALVGLVFGRDQVPPAARPPRAGVAKSPTPPGFWPAWVSLLACGSSEFCFAIWSSDVLRQHAGASSSVAALGVSAVVLGIVLGRLMVARLAGRRADHLLYGFLGVILAGFCSFWLSTVPALAITGLLVSGVGIGPMFPLSIGRLIEASGGRPDLATARASMASGIAIGGGPFLIGALADLVGAYRSMLVVPPLLAGAVVAVRWSSAAARREDDPRLAIGAEPSTVPGEPPTAHPRL